MVIMFHCGYKISDLEGFDFVLAGDNHKVNYIFNEKEII